MHKRVCFVLDLVDVSQKIKKRQLRPRMLDEKIGLALVEA